VLEAAVWCALLLPLGFLGFALAAISYDWNQVQIIPESLMRETMGRVLTWRSDAVDGFFEVDEQRLVEIVDNLSLRALEQVRSQTFKVIDPSARACSWVYKVDPASGVLASQALMITCRSLGVRGDALDLTSALAHRLQARVAEPIRGVDGSVEGYVSQIVLVGVSVGGVFEGLAEYLESEGVQHAAVWVPREDVFL
jgi:hypothetical protein